MSFILPSQGIVQSEVNSTDVPLAASASFVGPWENVLNKYQEVSVTVAGEPTSAPGTLFIEFSEDGVVVVPAATLSFNGPNAVPQIFRIVLPLFRVRYQNGMTSQTAFRITTVYHTTSAIRLTRYLNDQISIDEPVQNVRAFIGGRSPDGTFTNVPVTHEQNLQVQVADVGPLAEDRILGADKATFGAGVTVTRLTQIEAQFNLPLATLPVTVSATGTGAVTQNGLVNVTSGTGASASATLESIDRVVYKTAREIYAIFTASFSPPTSGNSDQRIGLFDDLNGFFIGYRGTTFGLTKRAAGVDTFTPLSAANLDTLSGVPDSRFTRGGVPEALIPSNINVWRIRFGWLGSAPVQFEILSPDGPWVTFDTIRQPNLATAPSIANPDLPLRSQVVKVAADATDLVIKTGSWDAGITASPSDAPQGTVSQVNSTTVPLAANATYTGQWEPVLDASTVRVVSRADVDSAVGGWRVEWSTDGVTSIGLFAQALSAQANRTRAIVLTVRSKFFRFVYVNGPAAQTSFLVQTVISTSGSGLTTQVLNQALTEDNVAPPVRGVVAAKSTADGVFRNVTGETVGAVYAQHVDGSKFTQPVSAAALPLPTGAATEATLASVLSSLATRALDATVAAGNSILSSILAKLDVALSSRASEATLATRASAAAQTDGSQKTQVTNFPATQPVSAVALPLPAGASTSTLQTAGNASLTSIDGKTPTLVGGRQPVDGSGVTQPISAASLPLPTGAATAALQTAGNASLANIDADLGPAASYRHLSANGSTTCKASAGRLRDVVVNKAGSGANTLTLTDGVNVIAVIDTTIAAAPERSYNVSFSTNLVAALTGGGAADVTITFD